MINMSDLFLIINFDGYNVGLADDYNETWLEFDTKSDAYEVAAWYTAWINGVYL